MVWDTAWCVPQPNPLPLPPMHRMQVANTGVAQAAVQALTDKMTPAIRRNAAALLLQVPRLVLRRKEL